MLLVSGVVLSVEVLVVGSRTRAGWRLSQRRNSFRHTSRGQRGRRSALTGTLAAQGVSGRDWERVAGVGTGGTLVEAGMDEANLFGEMRIAGPG